MARRFTAGSQYVGAALPAIPNPSLGVTLSCWAIFDSSAAEANVMMIRVGTEASGSPNNNATQMLITTAGVFEVHFDGGATIIASGFTVANNTPYHFAYTWDTVTGRVYVNGQERANNTTSPTNGVPAVVMFGRYDNAFQDPLIGKAWDGAIWSVALTPEEILRLYVARDPRGSIRPNNLYNWWPLTSANATAERSYDGRNFGDLSVVSAAQFDMNPQLYYPPRMAFNFDRLGTPATFDATQVVPLLAAQSGAMVGRACRGVYG